MKRIFILLIALLICASAFSGCAIGEPDNTIDPDNIPGGAVKATDFPKSPPRLFVHDGVTRIDAWRGTCSWYVEDENGIGGGIEADSPHPLDCLDSLPVIKISKRMTLALSFDGSPSEITVKRYKPNAKSYDDYKEITVTGSTFEASGDHLYEVIATWNGANYSGRVYFAFRTEKYDPSLDLSNDEYTLEFRIAENVDDYDFSAHQPKYGIMGGWEYYGKGYVPSLDENGQQVDPEHCVIYTVTSYPDYSSNSRCITRIKITDPAVKVYGLSLSSSFEEIKSTMTAEGFAVTESAAEIRAEKDNFRFTFSKDEITLCAEVTNHSGIIF